MHQTTQEAVRLIIYGDFNCLFCALASARTTVLEARGLGHIEWRAVEHDPTIPITGEPATVERREEFERDLAHIRGLLVDREADRLRVPDNRANTSLATVAAPDRAGHGSSRRLCIPRTRGASPSADLHRRPRNVMTRDSDTAVNCALRLKRDLGIRPQIHDLVVRFYREIVFDDLLGPVFEEVAEVDWSTHIPKLIDYWCRVLLGEPGYDGYILHPHQEVHAIESFRPELFDRWYLLFVEAIDAGWRGPIADRAKVHAARMAGVLSGRLLSAEWIPHCGRRSTAR